MYPQREENKVVEIVPAAAVSVKVAEETPKVVESVNKSKEIKNDLKTAPEAYREGLAALRTALENDRKQNRLFVNEKPGVMVITLATKDKG